jgi:hypothetical protein
MPVPHAHSATLMCRPVDYGYHKKLKIRMYSISWQRHGDFLHCISFRPVADLRGLNSKCLCTIRRNALLLNVTTTVMLAMSAQTHSRAVATAVVHTAVAARYMRMMKVSCGMSRWTYCICWRCVYPRMQSWSTVHRLKADWNCQPLPGLQLLLALRLPSDAVVVYCA